MSDPVIDPADLAWLSDEATLPGNWFQQQRLRWIRETAGIYGFINRKHVVRKFGISEVHASADLQLILQIWPGFMHYDTSLKYYVADEAGTP
ncbi:Hypothetical protein NGAL_HAMBI2605_59340 [Neorhizobium galegae bv. orientalis]|nr:Hypothetical protein NGAL_HAMBI2605_59340 [Neorhizobium galegae bv. orientalis]